MADLVSLFGQPFRVPVEIPPPPPEQQLIDAIREAGLEPPDAVRLDGEMHRFKSGTKGRGGHDKPGWYIAYGDGIPAGSFGCWRSGIAQNWRADIGRKVTPAEEMALARRMAEMRAIREAEQAKVTAAVGDVIDTIWSQGMAASDDHPYLKRKGVSAHGVRLTGDGRLMVPMIGNGGELVGLQYIANDGDKKYHSGSKAGGAFWCIGSGDGNRAMIAEGFATAASVHAATGAPCYVAFSASNLPVIAAMLREQLGSGASITVVADNDSHGVGRNYADKAAAESGARVVMPPEPGTDANDYAQAGHDLAALLAEPDRAEWLVTADDWSREPAPIAWLIKRWAQDNALIMVHGPSGSGKTFLVLDWCLRIAAGSPEWRGHRVRHGAVVYLAGEGHHGLRARLAGWKQREMVESLGDMWLSRSGCDLNTPAGYTQTVGCIRAAGLAPRLIVVDTLHRFLSGDENSAQDAKTMLDACSSLMAEFRCAVLLVHHTGVSDEAQHRARGSSAWRGALDIEISVQPDKSTPQLVQVAQKKAKDSELCDPLWARLESTPINGWFDEDGEQVTTAVMVEAEPPEAEKASPDGKVSRALKYIERAWFGSGCELRDGFPYVSRSALVQMLEADGIKASTAANYAKAAYENGPICLLINGSIITPFEHGWIVSEPVNAGCLMALNHA